DPDQAGAAAADRRGGVRARGAVGGDPGRVFQVDRRTACVPDGAASSPLRVVQSDDVEAAMIFSVDGKRVTVAGAARSGLAAAELLARRGAAVTVSDTRADVPGT